MGIAIQVGAAVASGAMLAALGLMPHAPATAAGTPAAVAHTVASTPAAADAVHFPGNDGKHHTVTYDARSLKVDGQRLNVFSGEFHYWREPSTADWRDIFQKMRASGFNAVSLYFFWASTRPSRGRSTSAGSKTSTSC